jgi:hypothetical protein
VLVEKWVVKDPGTKRSENGVLEVAVAAPSTAVFSLVQSWSEAHASLVRHNAGSYCRTSLSLLQSYKLFVDRLMVNSVGMRHGNNSTSQVFACKSRVVSLVLVLHVQ